MEHFIMKYYDSLKRIESYHNICIYYQLFVTHGLYSRIVHGVTEPDTTERLSLHWVLHFPFCSPILMGSYSFL